MFLHPVCFTVFFVCVPKMLPQFEEDIDHWENCYCVLMGQTLLCYRCQEDLESKHKPLLVIPITKVGSKYAVGKRHLQRWTNNDSLCYDYMSKPLECTNE